MRCIIAPVEDIKCNFCSEWFQVSTQFARINKHKVNSCPKCILNFNFKIVDSKTHQIYNVILLKSGYKLFDKHIEQRYKFSQALKSKFKLDNLGEFENHLIDKYYDIIEKLEKKKHQYQQNLKDRISQTFNTYLKKVTTQWNNASNDLNEPIEKISQLESKIFNKMYDPLNISIKNIFDQEEISKQCEQIKKIFEKLHKQFDKKYFENFLKTIFTHTDISQDKQNICVNSLTYSINQPQIKTQKKHLKYKNKFITSKNQTSKQQNLCKYTHSMQCSISTDVQKPNQNLLSQRKTTKSKNVLSSSKSFKNINSTILNFGDEHQFSTLQKVSSSKNLLMSLELSMHDGDTQTIERNQIAVLLKQDNNFESFMSKNVQQQQQLSDKQWGKSLISAIIETKSKTYMDQNICELVYISIRKIDFLCYLKTLNIKESVNLVRMVKVKMLDKDFDCLLNWLTHQKCRNISSLLVTNNKLTQNCLEALINFKIRFPKSGLSTVYMGNNYIKFRQAQQYINKLKKYKITVYL